MGLALGEVQDQSISTSESVRHIFCEPCNGSSRLQPYSFWIAKEVVTLCGEKVLVRGTMRPFCEMCIEIKYCEKHHVG